VNSIGDTLSDQTMIDLFRSEMETLGATLNNGLLDLEENPGSMAALEILKKTAHSIKGGAKIAELDAAVRLAHAMEDVFKAVEEGTRFLTQEDIDRLLAATDLMIRMAETAGEGEPAEPSPEEAEARIAEVTAIGAEDGEEPGPPAAEAVENFRGDTSRPETAPGKSGRDRPPTEAVPRHGTPATAGRPSRRTRNRPAAPPPSPSRGEPGAPSPPASLMDAFREEMDGWSGAMMECLDILREDPFDPAALPTLATTIDELLGGARLVELDDVAALGEAMSRCFEAADAGKLELVPEQLDRLVDAVDLLLRYTRSPERNRDPGFSPRAFEQIRADIAAFTEEPKKTGAPERPSEFETGFAPPFEAEPGPDEEADAAPDGREPLESWMESGMESGVDSEPAAPDEWPMQAVYRQGETGAGPEAREFEHGEPEAGPEEDQKEASGEELEEDSPETPGENTPLPARRESAEPAVPPPDAAEGPRPVHAPESERTVRVTATKIERLMGLAGEVVVGARWLPPFSESLFLLKRGQSELSNTLEELQKVLETGDVHRAGKLAFQARERLKGLGRDLGERMGELDMFTSVSANLSDRLYHEVIGVRMSPFAEGIRGYRRRLRDMARELGKRVRLEVVGESTEVDRDILERINTPLNHLLRNAVDHGIESPAERRAAGKDKTGVIRLEAAHRAGMLIITVSDDGRGVEPDAIRRRLRERRIPGAESAERMSEPELLDFLFQPGFSTAPEITHLSGRGVGLNVVQSAVHEVGGMVRAASRPGEGTRFQMELPLALSVVRTFLVEIAGEPYAFPLARIDRCLRLAESEIQTVEDRQYFLRNGRNVSLVNVHEVLEIADPPPLVAPVNVVVVSDRDHAYGLVVDRFLGEFDLVVRPLDPRLGKVPDISAAAVMLDGSPVLIFDVEDLVHSIDNLLSGSRRLRKISPAEAVETETPPPRILVVEDSFIVREKERKLLENRGYQVEVAVDGMDGWNLVRTAPFDMVISDVDMPRMNGFELIRNIKKHAELGHLPVIIVSYKFTEADRLEGLEAGADYYLSKTDFDDNTLIDAVIDLIGEP
jgi:two-component system sensor histidine kinase and response regulator WspE